MFHFFYQRTIWKVYCFFLDGNITGGCRKVRVSRFIGNKDRNCTSIKPVRYSLCGGFCLPKFRLTQLIYGPDYNRILQKAKHRWRCVANTFRYKKVRVFCPDDGSVLRYRIKIVNSCVCKEFKREHNEGRTPDQRFADSKESNGWSLRLKFTTGFDCYQTKSNNICCYSIVLFSAYNYVIVCSIWKWC